MYVDKKIALACGLLAVVLVVLVLAMMLFPVGVDEVVGADEAVEEVALTTDKTSYAEDETIAVTVKNGLKGPVWFNTMQNCFPGIELMSEQEGEWVSGRPQVLVTKENCITVTKKLEPGASTILEYELSKWHDQEFLGFASYRLGIGYSLEEEIVEPIPAYSNEFLIGNGEGTVLEG